jgi:Raf kinase inhibitor-like YbhB/YbcL family protein
MPKSANSIRGAAMINYTSPPSLNSCFRAALASLFFICLSSGANAFEVKSPAFKDGDKLPRIYACSKQGGKDHSWEITINDTPSEAVSLVIIMDDPDAQPVAGKTWVHWNVSNIPADTKSLPSKKRGKKLGVGKLGYSSRASKSYHGMCPPNGEHKYTLAVYALNVEFKKTLDQMTRKRFERKYKDKIIVKAEISGRWG